MRPEREPEAARVPARPTPLALALDELARLGTDREATWTLVLAVERRCAGAGDQIQAARRAADDGASKLHPRGASSLR